MPFTYSRVRSWVRAPSEMEHPGKVSGESQRSLHLGGTV